MKTSTYLLILVVLFGSVFCSQDAVYSQDATHSQDTAEQTSVLGEGIRLFDGKSTDGWMGREDLWAVEDGMIVGRTSDDEPIKQNTFLIYQNDEMKDGKLGDFELTLQFKIESGNSGVQYRSKIIDEKEFVVGGYQADIDFQNRYAGILYEEKGRGILAQRGESVTVDTDGEKLRKRFAESEKLGKGIHPGKWNDFRVVARGNRLEHYINGAKTMELIDNQPEKASPSGVIALQLHRGPAMTVRFKNIVLTPFVAAEVEATSSEEAGESDGKKAGDKDGAKGQPVPN